MHRDDVFSVMDVREAGMSATLAVAWDGPRRSSTSCIRVPQPPRRDNDDEYNDQRYQRILHQLPREPRAASTSAEHALTPPEERGCPSPSTHRNVLAAGLASMCGAVIPHAQPARNHDGPLQIQNVHADASFIVLAGSRRSIPIDLRSATKKDC
jgi:hypothetical protein